MFVRCPIPAYTQATMPLLLERAKIGIPISAGQKVFFLAGNKKFDFFVIVTVGRQEGKNFGVLLSL